LKEPSAKAWRVIEIVLAWAISNSVVLAMSNII